MIVTGSRVETSDRMVHLNQDHKTHGKMFQREQIQSARTVRWAQGWSVLETKRKLMCLGSRVQQGQRGRTQW